ncbi:LysR family transcriptional regulator [Paraburkholderia sp. J67]|uniref:LysR family transcriptional regulator n=1 Tax=Paraburkholderia sp. J67 TaxID=2805435 RepID=UPI002ABD95C4|nr:LysR family transcriptional regulator [Paraburkholderia sp. J67]
MDYIESLRIFRTVVEAKGFRRAADRLGTTPPVISRAVASLEQRLGVRLFNRTTRQVSLTESATRVYDRCCQILDDLSVVEDEMTGQTHTPSGVLRLVAHTTATNKRLVPLIASFKQRYPKVSLDITLTERPVDLVADGFDLGVVLPFMLSSDQAVTRLLERMPLGIFATEAYLASHARPVTPEDLAAHTFVVMPPSLRKPVLTFRGEEHQDLTIPIRYDVSSNNPVFNREMVLMGFGIGALPIALVEEEISSGKLVRLLEAFEIREGAVEIRLAYNTRTLMPAKVRAFIDHAGEFFDELAKTTATAGGRSNASSAS